MALSNKMCIRDRYGLGSNSQLRKWLAAYKKFGDEGLKRSRKKENYSFEKKLSVVELYLSSEISYQDLALQEGITNPSMIVNWVKDVYKRQHLYTSLILKGALRKPLFHSLCKAPYLDYSSFSAAFTDASTFERSFGARILATIRAAIPAVSLPTIIGKIISLLTPAVLSLIHI